MIRVAVVEDDSQLRSTFGRIVDEADGLCCVGRYSNGEEALAGLPAAAPHVVPMDISMPGMTGVHFFNQAFTPAPELEKLTGRERQVLDALAEGQFYKEIADNLSISINTVRKHIKAVYEKLHVNSRHDAVTKFARR